MHNPVHVYEEKDMTQENSRTLLTVRQFSEKHPAFPQGSLRNLIFQAETNGFKRCIRRINSKVLLDEREVFSWVDQQNNGTQQ